MSMACGMLALNCESYLALKLILDSRVLALVLVLALRVAALASASSLAFGFWPWLHYWRRYVCKLVRVDFVIQNCSEALSWYTQDLAFHGIRDSNLGIRILGSRPFLNPEIPGLSCPNPKISALKNCSITSRPNWQFFQSAFIRYLSMFCRRYVSILRSRLRDQSIDTLCFLRAFYGRKMQDWTALWIC